MKLFELTETTYDTKKRESVKIAEWYVFPCGLHNEKIAIQKVAPTEKRKTYKVFRVEDSSEFVFKALKTKIKAMGGAEGLVDWMIKDQELFSCRIIQLLNFAWNEMKYECL